MNDARDLEIAPVQVLERLGAKVVQGVTNLFDQPSDALEAAKGFGGGIPGSAVPLDVRGVDRGLDLARLGEALMASPDQLDVSSDIAQGERPLAAAIFWRSRVALPCSVSCAASSDT
jgi:hypothetical protein